MVRSVDRMAPTTPRRRALTDTSLTFTDVNPSSREVHEASHLVTKRTMKQFLTNEAEDVEKYYEVVPKTSRCHRRTTSAPGVLECSLTLFADSKLVTDSKLPINFHLKTTNPQNQIDVISSPLVDGENCPEVDVPSVGAEIRTRRRAYTDDDRERRLSSEGDEERSERREIRRPHRRGVSLPEEFSNFFSVVSTASTEGPIDSRTDPVEDSVEIPGVIETPNEFREESEYRNTQFFNTIRDERWSTLELACEEYPEAATANSFMFLYGEKAFCIPLHLACKKRPLLSSIDALITAHPYGVYCKESLMGSLPIHIACMYAASPGVVKALIAAYPDSVTVQDRDGNFPIHYACSFASDEVVQILIRAYPSACRFQNKKQKLPLHLACSRPNANVSLIDALLRAYPEAAGTEDNHGSFPLHVACSHRVGVDLIKILLDAYPNSIFARDRKHRNPMLLAKTALNLSDHDAVILTLKAAERNTGGVMFRTSEGMKSRWTRWNRNWKKCYHRREVCKFGYMNAY